MPKPKKGKSSSGGVVVRAWVRHWRTGKRIYPVNAQAIAFTPKKKS